MKFEDAEPVLRATYRLLEDHESATPDSVCAAVGRPPGDEQTLRALAVLYEEDYIGGMTIEQAAHPIFIEATSRGREYASDWPDRAAVSLLLRLLDERIANATESGRGGLQRVRDAVEEARPEDVAELLAAYKASDPGGG